jgi:hypothetical protein
MKHVITIPEVAQRLGSMRGQPEELARDTGALSWPESMGPCICRQMWGPSAVPPDGCGHDRDAARLRLLARPLRWRDPTPRNPRGFEAVADDGASHGCYPSQKEAAAVLQQRALHECVGCGDLDVCFAPAP